MAAAGSHWRKPRRRKCGISTARTAADWGQSSPNAWPRSVRPEPLITDRAVLTASLTMLQALLEPLRGLIVGIESFDRQIAASYDQHPDKEVFSSLPGAGPVLAPRLLAAFGADRERYQSAGEIQCFSGIAPVIKRSGKTKFVHRRLACPVVRPPEFPRIRPEFDPLSRAGRGPTTINSGGVATSITKRSGPWPTSGPG
jgi:transposase